eukprot:356655-Chlamydomonas_euryale.AAC.7
MNVKEEYSGDPTPASAPASSSRPTSGLHTFGRLRKLTEMSRRSSRRPQSEPEGGHDPGTGSSCLQGVCCAGAMHAGADGMCAVQLHLA